MLFLQEKLEFRVKRKRNTSYTFDFSYQSLEFLAKKSSCFARKTKLCPLHITKIHRNLIKDLSKQNLTKDDYSCLRHVCRIHKAGYERNEVICRI